MENNVTRRNGYIYGPGTAQGFLRMQRQGIPRPVFAVEQKLKKLLQKKYAQIIGQMLKDFKAQIKLQGINADQLTADEDSDAFENLINFFEEMKKEQEAAEKAIENTNLKMQLGAAANNLENSWIDAEGNPTGDDAYLFNDINKIFQQNTDTYSKKLYQDGGPKLQEILNSFSIDKKELYERNLAEIREIYLDNARTRIYDEETALKHKFIEAINDYVTGKTDKLDVKQFAEDLYASSARMAQFFARDQLARLNKATTLATFQNAGVTKVKWITTHDVRVRKSHEKLDGQIFPVDQLPPEVDDYNCRCGLVPVEWAE